jgi:agmatinase
MKENLVWGGLCADSLEEADLVVMGIPFDGAVSAGRGAAAAPDRLRELSQLLPSITEEGMILSSLKIWDDGNVPAHLNWEKYFGEVKMQAYNLIAKDKFCLFLGGDHSVSIPLEAAFAEAHANQKIGIIHVDSHSDIEDECDGHRWSHACTQRRALELPNMEPAGLTLVGIRSYTRRELEFLTSHPEIRVIGAREVYRQGLAHTYAAISERYRGYQSIYLSIDIDVLDPAFAPGTGVPEGGGLSTRELMELVKQIMNHLPVKAADIVEISPPLDCANITSWAALKVIFEIFGGVFSRKRQRRSGSQQ